MSRSLISQSEFLVGIWINNLYLNSYSESESDILVGIWITNLCLCLKPISSKNSLSEFLVWVLLSLCS
jgi:hypothetical protein